MPREQAPFFSQSAAGPLPFCSTGPQAEVRQPIFGHIVFNNAGVVLHYSERLDLLAAKQPPIFVRNLTALLEHLLAEMPQVYATMYERLAEAASDKSGREVTILDSLLSGRCLVDASLARIADGNWILSMAVRPAVTGVPSKAEQDRLTGGGNRLFFEKELEAALQEMQGGTRRSVTVMFLELDRFKAVNESFGPVIGDTLLRVVSERLSTALRETDVLARLSGGMFGILLEGDADKLHATELSRRLLDLVRRPYRVAGHVINVGASVGVATAAEDGRNFTSLMRSADLALYHAKNAGQGTWNFFAPSMGERAQQRRIMELDLRKALAGEQFEVHYQPQIEVQSQTVVGMEALLRWRHPQQGLLLPGHFLDLAEELGLDVPIAEWTLRTACSQAFAWPSQLGVAVNVSSACFASERFLTVVEEALHHAHLRPERLELEITEQALMGEREAVHGRLEALRNLGVRVAIDGFGTGSASINQLVSFPFSKIKVDRSLVASKEADVKSRAVLRAVSGLGHDLSMQMMAVGVETLEHVAHARADGYASVQGFYYSDAVPAEKVAPMLASFSQKNR